MYDEENDVDRRRMMMKWDGHLTIWKRSDCKPTITCTYIRFVSSEGTHNQHPNTIRKEGKGGEKIPGTAAEEEKSRA